MMYGKTIKEIRIEKFKNNQSQFAEKIGITQPYLSLVENEKKRPSLDIITTVCKIAKIPVPIFFWKSVAEKDVAPEKKELFLSLKPTIDSMIDSIFNK